MEMNICLDAEMKKMGFRTMLPWKSAATTLQEEVRLRVRGLPQGRWENTKWKKICVDILISQEGERRQIHFCFSSTVTVWETKTQLRPVGLISRGKCCLLSQFPSEDKWRHDCGCALGLCDPQDYLPAEQWLSLKQSEMLNLQGVTVSSLAAWGCECFSSLTG